MARSMDEQRLRRIFTQLPLAERKTLLAFAEFLQSRVVQDSTIPLSPQLIPRPSKESVVAAIKRLSKSYPMLDKSKMLDETSTLMTEHIMHGRDAVEVIDKLEEVFLQHYEVFKLQEENC